MYICGTNWSERTTSIKDFFGRTPEDTTELLLAFLSHQITFESNFCLELFKYTIDSRVAKSLSKFSKTYKKFL